MNHRTLFLMLITISILLLLTACHEAPAVRAYPPATAWQEDGEPSRLPRMMVTPEPDPADPEQIGPARRYWEAQAVVPPPHPGSPPAPAMSPAAPAKPQPAPVPFYQRGKPPFCMNDARPKYQRCFA
jgi:hypothetical protein